MQLNTNIRKSYMFQQTVNTFGIFWGLWHTANHQNIAVNKCSVVLTVYWNKHLPIPACPRNPICILGLCRIIRSYMSHDTTCLLCCYCIRKRKKRQFKKGSDFISVALYVIWDFKTPPPAGQGVPSGRLWVCGLQKGRIPQLQIRS